MSDEHLKKLYLCALILIKVVCFIRILIIGGIAYTIMNIIYGLYHDNNYAPSHSPPSSLPVFPRLITLFPPCRPSIRFCFKYLNLLNLTL